MDPGSLHLYPVQTAHKRVHVYYFNSDRGKRALIMGKVFPETMQIKTVVISYRNIARRESLCRIFGAREHETDDQSCTLRVFRPSPSPLTASHRIGNSPYIEIINFLSFLKSRPDILDSTRRFLFCYSSSVRRRILRGGETACTRFGASVSSNTTDTDRREACLSRFIVPDHLAAMPRA